MLPDRVWCEGLDYNLYRFLSQLSVGECVRERVYPQTKWACGSNLFVRLKLTGADRVIVISMIDNNQKDKRVKPSSA